MIIVHQSCEMILNTRPYASRPAPPPPDISTPILDVNPIVRNEIRNGRLCKKISTKQLAELVHIDQSIIEQYESGTRFPSGKILIQLQEILGFKLT